VICFQLKQNIYFQKFSILKIMCNVGEQANEIVGKLMILTNITQKGEVLFLIYFLNYARLLCTENRSTLWK